MHYQFFNFVINFETTFKIFYYCTNTASQNKVWSDSLGFLECQLDLNTFRRNQFILHPSGTLNFLPLRTAKKHFPVVLVNLHQVITDPGWKEFSVQRVCWVSEPTYGYKK